MHRSEVSPAALARAKATLNDAPSPLDPKRTVHVIVDLQNAFVAEGGAAEVPLTRGIIDNVNAVADAVRSAGGQNVFVRFTLDENEPERWASMMRRTRPEALAGLGHVFGDGTQSHALWPGLSVSDQDLVMNKTRFSALTPGTCDLADVLRQRDADTVIITGTLSNCCCEATARDAMQMGYSVFFVEDGNATYDDASHNNTLNNLCAFGYADICTAADIVARLYASAQAQA